MFFIHLHVFFKYNMNYLSLLAIIQIALLLRGEFEVMGIFHIYLTE